jgi:peptide chain release factor subunit 1
MKISAYFPKETKAVRKFLEEEINTAKRIKSKETRETVVNGLKKIQNSGFIAEIETTQGYAFFVDEEEFTAVPYDGKQKIYQCGNNLVLDPFQYLFDSSKYLLVAMDINHCTIGILFGKRIDILWDKEFYIDGKHRKGGQSAARYERDREEQKKHMFKAVGAKIQEILQLQDEAVGVDNETIRQHVFNKIKVKQLYAKYKKRGIRNG